MANVYVYSGAGGANDGSNWANAYTNLSSISTKAAGDLIFVAHDHAQTQGTALTVTSPGTEASPCRIYCVNRAGSVPPVSADLATTATVSVTGSSISMTLAGSVADCYGITFNAGDAANTGSITVANTTNRSWRLTNCALRLLGTSASSRINLGSTTSAGGVFLDNTTVQFGSTNQQITLNSRVTWRNTPSAITGATIPSTVMAHSTGGYLFAEGVDFSAVGSGKTLLAVVGSHPSYHMVKDCKLGVSGTTAGVPAVGYGGLEIVAIRSDSGDTNYRSEKYGYGGTLTAETTIVRTGGATDGNTPISWKIVTSANSEWEFPFECLPISIWNGTIGSSVTVTIEGIWGGGAVPLNDEIWIDVEYLGTSGFPIASGATCTKADGLATGSNLASGSGTWGGSTTQFAMSVTITPQERGPLTIYVKAAKVSSTFYVDPKPVIS